MLVDGQVRQETVDVVLGEFARMVAIVEPNVSTNPVDAGFLGSTTVVPNAQHFDHVIVEPGRWLVGEQT